MMWLRVGRRFDEMRLTFWGVPLSLCRASARLVLLAALFAQSAAAQDGRQPIEQFLANPAASSEKPSARRSLHALNEIFGDRLIAENVRTVRRRAGQLDPADRFEFLADWIFPGATHSGIRLSGEFIQTDPPLMAMEQQGGEIVSPVFDLLDAAGEMGRLEVLRRKIAAVPDSGDEYQQRAKAALRLLISLELGDREVAAESANQLQALVVKQSPQTVADMWPETLAVYRGLLRSGAVPEVGDLLNSIYLQRIRPSTPRGLAHWHAHVASLMGRYRQLVTGASPESLAATTDLANWVPTSRARATARGHGSPHSRWVRDHNDIHHLSGLDEDYLLFRSPLRGNFEVEVDIGAEATTQFFAAGKYFGPRVNANLLETGTFRAGPVLERLDPPFSGFDAWVRFRAVFRDRVREIYLNGRLVDRELLTENHDPWIGVRSWSNTSARFRNVQISGDPQILDAVLMSASKQLEGWGPYYEESAGYQGAIWQHVDEPEGTGQIRGRRVNEHLGTVPESLLRYHRPLTENDSIEYDFFYEPGKIETHPALDRLAFMIDPDGVRIHWITDGRFDPSETPPDNILDEPKNRRGPAQLPLLKDAWNHMRLSLVGSTVTLELNDQPIYERELESNNRRTFGLFRYADQTEVRVRNVVMQGDWPKKLVPPAEQELADAVVASLNANRAKLTAEFVHDFAKDGLPDQYFRQERTNKSGEIIPRPDGVLTIRPSTGPWSAVGVKLRFAAMGDFDIEASFEQFHAQSDKQAAIMLLARLDDSQQHRCRLSRMLNLKGRQQLNAAVSVLHQDGSVTYDTRHTACEASAGRLRLVRRGNTVHYLFAEHDSPVFRRLRSEEVSDRPTVQEGIGLLTDCNGNGQTQAIWKSITLRAEQLTHLPPPPTAEPERLYGKGDNIRLMNVQTQEQRKLLVEKNASRYDTIYWNLGWSHDSRSIAFKARNRQTQESEVAIADIDSPDGFRILHASAGLISPDFTWSADNQQISNLFPLVHDGKLRRFYTRNRIRYALLGKSL